LLFLGVVAVVSVPFFVVGALCAGVRVGAMRLPASAVMFVVPVVAACGLVWRDDGVAGVVGLLGRVVDRPSAGWGWYVVAVVVAPVIGVVSWGVLGVADGTFPGLPLSFAAVPGLVVLFVVAAACEELGWTVYATDALQARFGLVRAGLGLGVFWAVWHVIPLWQAGHPVGWIGGWFVGTVAVRVLIVWLHDRSGGSAGVAILLHAMVNVTAAYTPGLDRAVSTIVTGVVTAGLALAVLWVPAGDRSRRGRRV
jgi:membrane protease YdiL (CAAX protease family)